MIRVTYQWKIEMKTGDSAPQPEWLEVRGYGKRYRYVDRSDAEEALAAMLRVQPHNRDRLRIAPV